MVPGVTIANTINISGNNVTLTLSWREPFNNLDPIVSFTVSCSGDVTCPSNFTTTDNTTRSYTVTNLTPMTNYTFSVVATNSVGSGEAGVVMITTPSGVNMKPNKPNGSVVSSTTTTTTTTNTIAISSESMTPSSTTTAISSMSMHKYINQGKYVIVY